MSRKRALFNPTIQEIESDPLTQIANENWRNLPQGQQVSFSPELVDAIFAELQKSGFTFPRIMLLEFSQYLEKYDGHNLSSPTMAHPSLFPRYLWPHFDPKKASQSHLLSIVLMVNEKFRERSASKSLFMLRLASYRSRL